MKNYELYEFDECLCQNFAAKAANVFELGFYYSYQSATKLQNSNQENSYHS